MDGPAKNPAAALNDTPGWGAVGKRQEFLSRRRFDPVCVAVHGAGESTASSPDSATDRV